MAHIKGRPLSVLGHHGYFCLAGRNLMPDRHVAVRGVILSDHCAKVRCAVTLDLRLGAAFMMQPSPWSDSVPLGLQMAYWHYCHSVQFSR